MYTGDDFNYDRLILGDGQGHSDALLGIFDAIAPAASVGLDARSMTAIFTGTGRFLRPPSRSRGTSSRLLRSTIRPELCSSRSSTDFSLTSAWCAAWRARGPWRISASCSSLRTGPACSATPTWPSNGCAVSYCSQVSHERRTQHPAAPQLQSDDGRSVVARAGGKQFFAERRALHRCMAA